MDKVCIWWHGCAFDLAGINTALENGLAKFVVVQAHAEYQEPCSGSSKLVIIHFKITCVSISIVLATIYNSLKIH